MRRVSAFIDSIKLDRNVETEEEFLDVTLKLAYTTDEEGNKLEKPESKLVEALNEDNKLVKVAEIKKLGFKVGTSKDEITEAVKKFVEQYNVELQHKEDNKERDEQSVKTTEVVKELTGVMIH